MYSVLSNIFYTYFYHYLKHKQTNLVISKRNRRLYTSNPLLFSILILRPHSISNLWRLIRNRKLLHKRNISLRNRTRIIGAVELLTEIAVLAQQRDPYVANFAFDGEVNGAVFDLFAESAGELEGDISAAMSQFSEKISSLIGIGVLTASHLVVSSRHDRWRRYRPLDRHSRLEDCLRVPHLR